MRILYIHRTQGKGVEGIHINGIIKSFIRMGHTVDIVCPVSKIDNKVSSKHFAIISEKLPEIFFEIFEFMYNFIAFFNIVKKNTKEKYNFIYERFAFTSWAGALAAKAYGIPYILEVNYTSFTPLVRKRSKIMLPLVRFLERVNLKRADGIFVVSSFLRRQIEVLGSFRNKIYLTPNAVDEEIFYPDKEYETVRKKFNLNGEIVIGFVGGFYPWHGVELLVKAVSRLEDKRNDIALLLVGDGPMKNSLQSLSAEILKSTKVIFTGEVISEQLPCYIKTMDICVMPHSNAYGSPMKVFEYMAMEKPVIAPRLGPLEDVLRNDENGLLFEPLNIDALSSCMLNLIENKHLRTRLSQNAKKTILKRHLWRHNAEKIITAYDNAICHE